jgi:uncharacterized glyoxalase superfamily protein PhnB
MQTKAKIGSQVYVSGSVQAAKDYCNAFGLIPKVEIKNDDGTQYMHCELFCDDDFFMALSEAPPECDTTKKTSWQQMAFNVTLGSREAVQTAFDILSKGGNVIDGPAPCPWNEYCSNLIDKYGVFWWIAI